MSEVVYSTIADDDIGKLISVSVPYDLSTLNTEDDLAFARAIHDDLQQRLQQWFEEEFER
jgi:hypothetical protein